jgi:hypothetical protein
MIDKEISQYDFKYGCMLEGRVDVRLGDLRSMIMDLRHGRNTFYEYEGYERKMEDKWLDLKIEIEAMTHHVKGAIDSAKKRAEAATTKEQED